MCVGVRVCVCVCPFSLALQAAENSKGSKDELAGRGDDGGQQGACPRGRKRRVIDTASGQSRESACEDAWA